MIRHALRNRIFSWLRDTSRSMHQTPRQQRWDTLRALAEEGRSCRDPSGAPPKSSRF